MTPSTSARRAHRRVSFLIVVLLVTAIALSWSSLATAQVKVGPSVPAAGVGTAAARNSPNCGPDGKLAYAYSVRPPCTRPLEKGESNGGATTMGVDREDDQDRAVAHAARETTRDRATVGRPIDRATGAPGYADEAYRDWEAVLAHSFNTWGRTLEFGVVNQTATDEAAQHADALSAAEQKPFAVISDSVVPVPVFAADLVARKIIVFQGGVNNAEAARQAPYRWGRRLRRSRGERGAVRGAEAPGRDGEVVG